MITRLIIFIFLFPYCNCAWTQSHYLASFQDEFVDCVSLSTDGSRYEMFLTINYNVKPDAGIVLSVGSYKSRDGMLILSDDASGYQMSFEKDGKDLIPKVSYPFLIGHKCNYAGENYPYAKYKIKQRGVTREVGAPASVADGIFSTSKSIRGMVYRKGIWLELKHGCYKSFVGHELLSQGKFKMSGSTLLLTDDMLNKQFVFLISGANILSAEDFIGPSQDYYRVIKRHIKRQKE